MAIMLLLIVAAIMTLFYLVNSSVEGVRKATWLTLNASQSIFSAVLLFHTFQGGTNLIFGLPDEQEHPTRKLLAWNFARMAFLAVLLYIVLWMSKWLSFELMKSVGLLGAHMVGFSAIAFFGELQRVHYFAHSVPDSLLAAMLSAVFIFGTVFPITHIRFARLPQALGLEHEGADFAAAHRWALECCYCENEAAALCLGLLLCQVVKYAVCGRLASVEGYPKGKTTVEVNMLLGVCSGLGVLVVLSSLAFRAAVNAGAHAQLRRFIHLVQAVAAMTMGWCLFFWSKWFFWNITNDKGIHDGDLMEGRAIMFGGWFFVGFGLIVTFHILGGPRNVVVASFTTVIGLVLGLSWESCVNTAIMGLSKVTNGYVEYSVKLGLVLFVVPAWKMYIMPKAVQYEEKEEEEVVEQARAARELTRSATVG